MTTTTSVPKYEQHQNRTPSQSIAVGSHNNFRIAHLVQITSTYPIVVLAIMCTSTLSSSFSFFRYRSSISCRPFRSGTLIGTSTSNLPGRNNALQSNTCVCIDTEAKHKSVMKYQYPVKSKSKLGRVDECANCRLRCYLYSSVKYIVINYKFILLQGEICLKPAVQCDH